MALLPDEILEALERRGLITTDPNEAERCCGGKRDADGFCRYREYHPVYIETRTEDEQEH